MKRYHLNYFCCAFSLFAAVVSAMTHQLGFLLINFFFAVWNWYVAEALRAKELKNEENSEDSGNDTQDDE